MEAFVGGTAAQESRDKDLVPPGKFGRRDFVQVAGNHLQEGGGGVPAEAPGAAFRHARGGAGGGAHGGGRAGVSGAAKPENGQRGTVPAYSGTFFGVVQVPAGGRPARHRRAVGAEILRVAPGKVGTAPLPRMRVLFELGISGAQGGARSALQIRGL